MTRASLCCGLTAAIAALVQPGCGAPAGDRAAVEAPPPPGADLLFAREGVPGPWWRRGSTQDSFDAELGLCLSRSKQARAAPGTTDPADAAYRSFLECMDQRDWVRGLPPRREPTPEG